MRRWPAVVKSIRSGFEAIEPELEKRTGEILVIIGSAIVWGVFTIFFKDPILAFFLIFGINIMISGSILMLIQRKKLFDQTNPQSPER